MTIYITPEIAEVEALYPYLKDRAFQSLPIREQLAKQAETLRAAHTAGDPRAHFQIVCWWPHARGRSREELKAAPFTSTDAHETIAREYGFDDWAQAETLSDKTTGEDFETALDLMLTGDKDQLTAILEASPHLATTQSQYGHAATLLHYIGANGVETHRQRVPLNAPEIASLLIEFGADTMAEANMYGGGQTPLALASTSAHPRNAGIADRLNQVLGNTEMT